MKILVLCGDHWHPARIAQEGLSLMADSQFTFDWVEDLRDWSAEMMNTYPLVILTKSNNVSSTDQTSWMTDRAERAFSEYVCNGNGLFAIHSGTTGYEDKSILRRLLGGVFTRHPEQCLVTLTPLLEHPLSVGAVPFTVKDEHYFMAMDDPEVDVFLTTASEHGEQPGGWRRMEGSGRVMVLTPGHNLEVWTHPYFQVLLLNCLRWCGKLE